MPDVLSTRLTKDGNLHVGTVEEAAVTTAKLAAVDKNLIINEINEIIIGNSSFYVPLRTNTTGLIGSPKMPTITGSPTIVDFDPPTKETPDNAIDFANTAGSSGTVYLTFITPTVITDIASSQDFSISIWVNPDNPTSATQHIIGLGVFGYLAIQNTTGYPMFAVKTNTTTTLVRDIAVATNQWTHVVGTYVNEVMTLFIDGENVSTIAKTGTLDTSTTPTNFTVGCSTTNTLALDGSVHQLAIYSRGLTDSEVKIIYKQQSGTLMQLTTNGRIIIGGELIEDL